MPQPQAAVPELRGLRAAPIAELLY